MDPAIAVSSSISALRYSSSRRRNTSRSLCGELDGGWPNKSLPVDRRTKIRSKAAILLILFCDLFFDFNSAPKGDVILDVTSRRLGIRIVPGGILVFLPVHQKTVVPGLPPPGAGRNGRAGAKVLPLQGALREVDIALNQLRCIAFRDYFAVPGCLCHN